MELLHKEKTDKILNAFYTVYNVLGYGFLEKVYENAMYIELKKAGLQVTKQQHIKVHYSGEEVGEYFADLLVENSVIIELKAAEGIVEEHEFQLLNYLKATDKETGLLLNFGKKPQFKRKVFQNINKNLR
jgi:GxxExxY protein